MCIRVALLIVVQDSTVLIDFIHKNSLEYYIRKK